MSEFLSDEETENLNSWVDEKIKKENKLLEEKIGFIGSSQIFNIIVTTLLKNEIVKSDKTLVSDQDNLLLWSELGVEVTEHNNDVVYKSDIIFICVKSDEVEPLANEIHRNHVRSIRDFDKIFVSLIEGVSINVIEKFFYFIPEMKVIRLVPNIALQVNESCTLFCAGQYVVPQDTDIIKKILKLFGSASEVPENMINAYSAITNSGPAFLCLMVESLAEGGVEQGLPKTIGNRIAAQMIAGCAKMLMETGKHPAVLRDEFNLHYESVLGNQDTDTCELRKMFINTIAVTTEKANSLGRHYYD